MSPVFPITLVLYAASCALYLTQVAVGVQKAAIAPQLARAARLLLIGAFASHAVEIGGHCIHGLHPASSAREAISFLSWAITGVYVGATWKQPLPLAGALLVPVVLVLEVAARLGPVASTGHASFTLLSTVHVFLAAAGVALFAVAAGDSVVYLLAEGQLKLRRHRIPSGSMPSLESLDRLNRRCIQLGFPLYTFALVTGAMWLSRLPPVGGKHWLLQPQYVLSVIAWALYAGLLLLRFLLGWRGRRAALVTIGGFAASVSVVIIYYVRSVVYLGGS